MWRRALLAVTVLVVGLASVDAQTSGAAAQHGPDHGTSTRVPGIEVLPLPSLPFSGRDRIAWTRPLDGGGSTTTYLESNVARDSQGRLYREEHRFGVAGASPESTLLASSVYDPASGTRTRCVYSTHQCSVSRYHPQRAYALRPVGASDGGRRFLTRESLGTKDIGGMAVAGTRETTTLEPGAAGNDQPLTTSREIWYSADLKTNLEVTRKDPREGTQVILLTILSRGEPDPAVFAVPAGFTVRDERRPVTAEGGAGSAAGSDVH